MKNCDPCRGFSVGLPVGDPCRKGYESMRERPDAPNLDTESSSALSLRAVDPVIR